MIEVKNLCKSYGDVQALTNVSLSIKAGEVIGLLGPNGAGKTTLMKILTGYLHPSSGTAEIDGLNVFDHAEQVQKLIGYLPENAPLYPELTVQGHLRMVADLRGLSREEQPRAISEAVRAVGLEDRLATSVGTLSKGYRQRVGLASAILHKPRLLILDEPTNGLDPTQIVEVRHLIKKLATTATVLVSTHILSEVEATCSRVIIVIRGEMKADSQLATLAATTDAIVTLENPGNEAAIVAALRKIKGVKGADISARNDGRTSFRLHGDRVGDLCPAVFQLAREKDWALCELRREVRTLESVFNELTMV